VTVTGLLYDTVTGLAVGAANIIINGIPLPGGFAPTVSVVTAPNGWFSTSFIPATAGTFLITIYYPKDFNSYSHLAIADQETSVNLTVQP
jgi:hypothetical protein